MLLYISGLIDVYFVDESGFSLTPNVSYAWQPIGEQWGIPSAKTKVMNVLSFLNVRSSHLVTYPLPLNAYMNSKVFIQCMDDFSDKITRNTAIIIDRAPWHTSWEVLGKIEAWENKGLYVFFLPSYSPHLNLIETLWRKIKHEWLKINDYQSKNTLKKKLVEIFSYYGSQYNIEFSMNIFK